MFKGFLLGSIVYQPKQLMVRLEKFYKNLEMYLTVKHLLQNQNLGMFIRDERAKLRE
jgi:hypothetical protein